MHMPVQGKHDCIKIIQFQRAQGCRLAVRCKADFSRDSLFLHVPQKLHGAAGGKTGLQLLHRGEPVQLIDIEIICVQKL